MFEIMQSQQYYARDKRNADFNHHFWHKFRVLLSSVNFITCLIVFILSNRNIIFVISEKIKNFTGDYERHSEFASLDGICIALTEGWRTQELCT